MKKLLLVVGLVVLFFAQSSYSIDYHTGFKSKAKWHYKPSSDNDRVGIEKGNIIDKKLWFKTHYWDKEVYKCFDFNSKDYFNIDRCETLSLEIVSSHKKEPKNTQQIKKFLNLVSQDICENAKIIFEGEIKKGSMLGGGSTNILIECPKVLVNKKRIEEEKKLAKQQEIIQEQEAKAQEEFDSQQKKMDTCKAYGFEAGTEAFGNCIFKLMELELEYAKLENEKLKLEAQAEQAKLNNQAALANSLATQAQAANQDKALRIQQFGLAMQGIANTLQPAQPTLGPRITCNRFGNTTHCF